MLIYNPKYRKLIRIRIRIRIRIPNVYLADGQLGRLRVDFSDDDESGLTKNYNSQYN